MFPNKPIHCYQPIEKLTSARRFLAQWTLSVPALLRSRLLARASASVYHPGSHSSLTFFHYWWGMGQNIDIMTKWRLCIYIYMSIIGYMIMDYIILANNIYIYISNNIWILSYDIWFCWYLIMTIDLWCICFGQNPSARFRSLDVVYHSIRGWVKLPMKLAYDWGNKHPPSTQESSGRVNVASSFGVSPW